MQNVLSTGDLHWSITQKIVAAIEAGADEFVMPWHTKSAGIGRPTNAGTARPYHGVNVVALWAEAILAGYASGYWATYRQWLDAGAQVRKGEHGALVVFYKPAAQDDQPDKAEDERVTRSVIRSSYVFNQEQVDGWSPPDRDLSAVPVDERAEAYVAATGATVSMGGNKACYIPSRDLVLMPNRAAFRGSATSTPTESYYATLLHELVHWTGAEHRLNRTFGRFGDETYAREELVAELGSAFLCADLGLANEPRADHAAYVASWLSILNDDRKAIFRAAAAADVATAFLGSARATSG